MAWDQTGGGGWELDLETVPAARGERLSAALLAGVGLTGSQTNPVQEGAAGLRVMADFRSTRKGPLRPPFDKGL